MENHNETDRFFSNSTTHHHNIINRNSNRIFTRILAFIGLSALLLLCLPNNYNTKRALLSQKELEQRVGNTRTMARTVVGGYSPSCDLNSEQIHRVADFIFLQLKQDQGVIPVPVVSFTTTLQEGIDNNLEFKIMPLEAYQQVVAGMNFRVTIGISVVEKSNEECCVGGITATVYQDLNGNLTVTSWGDEISCDQVVALRGDELEGEE